MGSAAFVYLLYDLYAYIYIYTHIVRIYIHTPQSQSIDPKRTEASSTRQSLHAICSLFCMPTPKIQEEKEEAKETEEDFSELSPARVCLLKLTQATPCCPS